MDESVNRAGNAVGAVVVRQFTPSRIESQLLAQVFELVCARQCDVEESRFTRHLADRIQRFGDSQQGIKAHSAGRRAA